MRGMALFKFTQPAAHSAVQFTTRRSLFWLFSFVRCHHFNTEPTEEIDGKFPSNVELLKFWIDIFVEHHWLFVSKPRDAVNTIEKYDISIDVKIKVNFSFILSN